MKKITIIFSTASKGFVPFAWLIRLWEKTPYSHVSIKLNTNHGDLIYQASHSMLNFMSFNNFLTINRVIKSFELEVTNQEYDIIMRWCIHTAGLPYAVKQVINVGLGKYIFKPDGEQRQVCSEVIGRILDKTGTKFKKPFDLLSPRDIYEVLDA